MRDNNEDYSEDEVDEFFTSTLNSNINQKLDALNADYNALVSGKK